MGDERLDDTFTNKISTYNQKYKLIKPMNEREFLSENRSGIRGIKRLDNSCADGNKYGYDYLYYMLHNKKFYKLLDDFKEQENPCGKDYHEKFSSWFFEKLKNKDMGSIVESSPDNSIQRIKSMWGDVRIDDEGAIELKEYGRKQIIKFINFFIEKKLIRLDLAITEFFSRTPYNIKGDNLNKLIELFDLKKYVEIMWDERTIWTDIRYTSTCSGRKKCRAFKNFWGNFYNFFYNFIYKIAIFDASNDEENEDLKNDFSPKNFIEEWIEGRIEENINMSTDSADDFIATFTELYEPTESPSPQPETQAAAAAAAAPSSASGNSRQLQQQQLQQQQERQQEQDRQQQQAAAEAAASKRNIYLSRRREDFKKKNR